MAVSLTAVQGRRVPFGQGRWHSASAWTSSSRWTAGSTSAAGGSIERDQLVDLTCIRSTGPDGRTRLTETHHGGLDVAADEQVRGRVTDIRVGQGAGAWLPVLRVPSGRALRGLDDDDDGHLEDPWTGEVVTSDSPVFRVSVRTHR